MESSSPVFPSSRIAHISPSTHSTINLCPIHKAQYLKPNTTLCQLNLCRIVLGTSPTTFSIEHRQSSVVVFFASESRFRICVPSHIRKYATPPSRTAREERSHSSVDRARKIPSRKRYDTAIAHRPKPKPRLLPYHSPSSSDHPHLEVKRARDAIQPSRALDGGGKGVIWVPGCTLVFERGLDGLESRASRLLGPSQKINYQDIPPGTRYREARSSFFS